jgi:hypothetical protein
MRCPPDIQISSLLYFLGQGLRQDKKITRLTGARPEEIVAQTVEYKPMKSAGDKIYLGPWQPPALCLHIDRERHRIVPGTHHGREFTAFLWYLFKPFQAEARDIPGPTKGSRWSTLIWWRLQYWLKHQTIPPEVPSDEVTFDLQSVSKIRTVDWDGYSERFEFDDIEGFRVPLKVWHGYAPYEEIPPTTLELISIGITSEAGSGVGVEADVDV